MSGLSTALIAWDYPPSPSGLSVAAREIAESLVGAGTDVTVYTLDRARSERVNGVHVVGCLPERSGVDGWLRKRMALGHLIGPRWFARRIAADHRKRPYACLEATNWYAPAALASRIDGLPFVTRHSTPGAFTGAVGATLRDALDGRFACRIEAATARRSNGHIFNTESHGEKVSRLYHLDPTTPSAVVGLSLPPERLSLAEDAPYPPPGDTVTMLFVGRAERRKGFDCLMEAMRILAPEAENGTLPAFKLKLVGVETGELPALPENAAQRIEAIGRVGEAALCKLYRSAHLVVAPSRYESFGLVYQEALAFGRPLVACASDASARTVVGDDEAGRLAANDTGEALADALRPVLKDAGLRETMHAQALAAAGRFGRAGLARETLALYAAARANFDQGRKGRSSASASKSRPSPGESAS
ncbi:glycosyltransferase family 4 protein [Pararhizobium mangrovi]|uniref:Glycosyltransferase family 4 protein n=1 Tax=Pararhizobium mangrovi TaxID=2590452 RepID=A0A506U6D3_9HYPH|nr:glycosyltransferase family 4 protein [Pararhizobium mangrovi]TPW28169.1 glycosyltransferase family 4 protein [Pararhizobium mangrovi]